MKNDNRKNIIIVVAILAIVLILFAFIRGCDKKEKNVKKKPSNETIEKITGDNDIEEVEEYYIPTTTAKVTPVVAPAQVKKEQILTLTLNGENVVYVDYNTTYTEKGAFASDTVDGNITANVVRKVYRITSEATTSEEVRTLVEDVDTTIAGAVYEVEYTVTNTAGETKTVVRQIVIKDVKRTIFVLNGSKDPAPIELGTQYNEEGVTAFEIVNDQRTTDINPTIKYYLVDDVTGAETLLPNGIDGIGKFVVRYTATDSNGVEYNLTRNVIVQDTTGPVIDVEDTEYKTNADIDLSFIYDNVTDADTNFDATTGVTFVVKDANDTVIDPSDIDNTQVGEYKVEISAIDPTGNTSAKTIILTVREFNPTVSITRTRSLFSYDFEFTGVTDAESYTLYYYDIFAGWVEVRNNAFSKTLLNDNPYIKVVDELGNEYIASYDDLN